MIDWSIKSYLITWHISVFLYFSVMASFPSSWGPEKRTTRLSLLPGVLYTSRISSHQRNCRNIFTNSTWTTPCITNILNGERLGHSWIPNFGVDSVHYCTHQTLRRCGMMTLVNGGATGTPARVTAGTTHVTTWGIGRPQWNSVFEFSWSVFIVTGHVALVVFTGTTKLVDTHLVKSLQLNTLTPRKNGRKVMTFSNAFSWMKIYFD